MSYLPTDSSYNGHREADAIGEVKIEIEATVLRCTCPDRGVSTHNGLPCPNPRQEVLGVIASSDDNTAVLTMEEQ